MYRSLLADGFVSGSFYIICQQDAGRANTAGCNLSAPYTDFVGVRRNFCRGSSFRWHNGAVNQRTGSQGQGNPNYILYKLAASQTAPAIVDWVCVYMHI